MGNKAIVSSFGNSDANGIYYQVGVQNGYPVYQKNDKIHYLIYLLGYMPFCDTPSYYIFCRYITNGSVPIDKPLYLKPGYDLFGTMTGWQGLEPATSGETAVGGATFNDQSSSSNSSSSSSKSSASSGSSESSSSSIDSNSSNSSNSSSSSDPLLILYVRATFATPDVTGTYNASGTYNSQTAYIREDNSYWIWYDSGADFWILNDILGDRSSGNFFSGGTSGSVYTIQYNNGTYMATGLVVSNS